MKYTTAGLLRFTDHKIHLTDEIMLYVEYLGNLKFVNNYPNQLLTWRLHFT